MTGMTDEEFLDYCDSMTETERCGFVPKNLARLLRLAGKNFFADYWDKQENQIVDHVHDEVSQLVREARALIKAKEAENG